VAPPPNGKRIGCPLTPERWAQIETLFHRATECESEHRAGLLDEACRNDPDLRQEVEALLSSDRSAGVHVQAAVGDSLDSFTFPLTGEIISHYKILDGLGGGGMGLVYRAEDIRLGRRVALKFLPEESIKDPAALGRFEREARSASALEHPSICPIYEFGEYEGRPFLVMQLLEGQTLRELIAAVDPEKSPLELYRLLDLAIQIVDGLDAAHRRSIIHRDIKPANIFVTIDGQAKILDFGLAKLARDVTVAGATATRDLYQDDRLKTPDETMQRTTPDLFLSRTGVAMGTAGYMSPEQARGENLDARTDLFSFGLVLYEMATGKRAFKGDTGPELHDAILRHTPAPVRKLNPELPSELENIINKALEKGREIRYQSAAEMRADLDSLRQEVQPRPRTYRRWAAIAGVVALVLVAAVFWSAERRQSTLPDPKFQQLTINSSENPVTGGAISPLGKTLAYTDVKGMHIKLIGTDETQPVPQPEALKNEHVSWEILPTAWFPDGASFVANAHPASERASAWSSQSSSVWIVSVRGGAPRKLRDNAIAWSVSPDGSLISFGTNKGRFGEREIWLMGPNGEQARKLYDGGEGSAICCLYFFPNGQRVSYISTNESGDTLVARDLKDGPVATLLPPSETKNLGEFSWLPGGQMIYSDPCDVVLMRFDTPCNIWIKRIDMRNGKLIERPRRLTNWAGLWANGPSATADGKRVVFLESSGHGSAYLADLEADGTRARNLRHFTLDEGNDAIADWTADSKAVILSFNRGDHYGLYKQLLNADTPEPIVAAASGQIETALSSPDGKWVIFQVRSIPGGNSVPVQLMRVPMTGGSPELIFSMREFSSSFCARPPSHLCAVAETTADRKQTIVSVFDPVKGRGPELARFDLDPVPNEDHWPLCDISSDGTRLVISGSPEGPIQIRSLRNQSARVIRVKGLNNMRNLGWTGDGKGLLVSTSSMEGNLLLHVDLQGRTQVLRRCSEGQGCYGGSSPDGRHLAIYDWKLSSNMWMMENF
jgi:serine/threonine protein kinase